MKRMIQNRIFIASLFWTLISPCVIASANSIDKLIVEFDEALVKTGGGLDSAQSIAQSIYQLGLKSKDKDVQLRGLARLAYVEIYFGRWRNKWEEKLQECESLCGEKNSIGKAEFFLYRGHINGKWRGELQDGIKEVKEAIWIARELEEDILLSKAHITCAELLLFCENATQSREHVLRGLAVADYTKDDRSIKRALYFATKVVDLCNGSKAAAQFARRLLKADANAITAQQVLAYSEKVPGFEKRLREKLSVLSDEPDGTAKDKRLARTQAVLANMLYLDGQYEEALALARKARDIEIALENPIDAKILSLRMLEVSAKMGLRNYQKTLEELLGNTGEDDTIPYYGKAIASLYANIGDFPNAYKWEMKETDKLAADQDRALKQSLAASREYWEMELRSRDYRREIARKEVAATRAWNFAIGGIVFVAIGLVTWRARANKMAFLKLQQEVERREIAESASGELREKLIRTQRLDAVGTLAAGIAHDFNNSLAVILVVCELLRKQLGDEHKGMEYVEEISEATRQASSTTKALLTFSGNQENSKTAVEFGKLVRDSKALIRHVINSSIELKFEIPSRFRVLCELDESQIKQVLLNLVINARDALVDGGEIRIVVSHSTVEGDFAIVEVIDNGCGIPDEIADRVFEPFSRRSSEGGARG